MLAESWLRPGMAAVFDMDGVIIDSNPLHRRAWAEYVQRFAIDAGAAIKDRMYGKRNDEIVRDIFGPSLNEAEVAGHGAAKEALYREMAAGQLESMLVAGVREFLQRHAGYPIAVATNAEPANVDFVLDGCSLRGYFKVIVDGHQVEFPKPHPAIYLRAAQLLGVRPEDCIVFEDSYSGIEAARSAGTRVVGVRTTHATLPGSDLEIDSFMDSELASWMRGQFPLAA